MDVKLRQFVRMRAGQHCEYCRLPQEFSELRFHIEHVTPRQHGGDDDADNLALACPDCNLRKGPNLTGIDPNTGEVCACSILATINGSFILPTRNNTSSGLRR
jgi:hypothetical protein